MRKNSLKTMIIESAKKHKNKHGRVPVALVSQDVFGGVKSAQRKTVAKVLDSEGIDRIKRVQRPQEKPIQPVGETIDVSQPPMPEVEDLSVELYLAARAKQGCNKAFLLLRTLV